MLYETEIAVVGSGAGGATVAKELAKVGKKVLIIERGSFVDEIGTFKTAVLKVYDRCALRTSREGTIVYRALMVGGTTVISCANAVRVLENTFKRIGLDLTEEFIEAENELNVAPLEEKIIGSGSRLIMEAANRLGLEMRPTSKAFNARKCVSCGACVLGCKWGAKWSALDFVAKAKQYGAQIITNTEVLSVVKDKGKAIGLVAVGAKGKVKIYAEKIIVAAGGIGSPIILRRTGINSAGNKMFVDLFNVTYGICKDPQINQCKEPSMAVMSTKHKGDMGLVLSSFVDMPLILRWVALKSKRLVSFKHKSLVGIMAKINDDSVGRVTERGEFDKYPTETDRKKLKMGAKMAKEVLVAAGMKGEDIILTKPRGGHPGGTCAIGDVVDNRLETEVKNLYVCDASVFPVAPGAPPILTIIALGKKLAKLLAVSV